MTNVRPAILCLILSASPALAADGDRPKLELMSYDQLAAQVRESRGKVVLVNFWGEFCGPCKREYPRYAELARKLQGREFVAISVALDPPIDAEARARVVSFVSKYPGGRTALMVEDPSVWQRKLHTQGPPIWFLFDAEGHLVGKWSGAPIDVNQVRQRIEELLAP